MYTKYDAILISWLIGGRYKVQVPAAGIFPISVIIYVGKHSQYTYLLDMAKAAGGCQGGPSRQKWPEV